MNSILDRFRTMPDKQLEEARKELANSYRQMKGLYAFKHLTEEMDRLYTDSYKSEDQCDIKEFGIAQAAEARGTRKAIDALRRKIELASK